MVGTHRHLCALSVSSCDEGTAGRSPGNTAIGRTRQGHPTGCSKVAPEQIGVSIAGAGEIINRNPFLVLIPGAQTGGGVHWSGKCNSVIGGTPDIEVRGRAEGESSQQDSPGRSITSHHRIARIAGCARRKIATVRPGGSRVGRSAIAGESIYSTYI